MITSTFTFVVGAAASDSEEDEGADPLVSLAVAKDAGNRIEIVALVGKKIPTAMPVVVVGDCPRLLLLGCGAVYVKSVFVASFGHP